MIKQITMILVVMATLVGCTDRPNSLGPVVMSGKIVSVEYVERACKGVVLTVILQDSSSATRTIFAGVKTAETYDLAVKMMNKPVIIKAKLNNDSSLMINCAEEVTSISAVSQEASQ